jgi:Flp pilus assembly protein TadD
MLQEVDDCQGAVEAFEQAVELQPQSPQGLNNLAYLLLECDGDLDRALALSLEAVERMATSLENRDTLGAVLMAKASKATDDDTRTALRQQARDQLRQSTRLGTSPAPWIRLAQLELEAGRPDEARTALLRAGDLDPTPDQQASLDALTERLRTSG